MERLNKGEILKHREDFFFVAEGTQWEDFNSYFTCGMILKYTPNFNNEIDMEIVEEAKMKYKQRQKNLETVQDPQIQQENEFLLLQKNTQAMNKGRDVTPKKRRERKINFL